ASAARARARTRARRPARAPAAGRSERRRSPHHLEPPERARARDHRLRVRVEPLLEERGVEPAEIRRRDEIAVVVEALREAGELAERPAARARAEDERGAGGAVVGPLRPVLLRAPAELRPHERQHAVREPARLEVALEGEE